MAARNEILYTFTLPPSLLLTFFLSFSTIPGGFSGSRGSFALHELQRPYTGFIPTEGQPIEDWLCWIRAAVCWPHSKLYICKYTRLHSYVHTYIPPPHTFVHLFVEIYMCMCTLSLFLPPLFSNGLCRKSFIEKLALP